MGRMEEELCYYRRLLFAGARQNGLPLSPSSNDVFGSMGYMSNRQQFRVSRYSAPGLQSSDFGTLPQGHMTTPYLASYHSALAATSSAAIPSPQTAENATSSFGSHRYTPPSVDSCSTRNQTPARSCPPSPESPTPFLPVHSSPNSPIITSPIPNHPNIGCLGANVGGGIWDLDISGWNANDEAVPDVTRGQGVPGYLQFMSTDSVGWSG